MSDGQMELTILGGVIAAILGMAAQYARDKNSFGNSRRAILKVLMQSLEEDKLQIKTIVDAYNNGQFHFTVVPPSALMLEGYFTSVFCKPTEDKNLLSYLNMLNLEYRALQVTCDFIKVLQSNNSRTSASLITPKLQNHFHFTSPLVNPCGLVPVSLDPKTSTLPFIG